VAEGRHPRYCSAGVLFVFKQRNCVRGWELEDFRILLEIAGVRPPAESPETVNCHANSIRRVLSGDRSERD
jgi:hypothetical protein